MDGFLGQLIAREMGEARTLHSPSRSPFENTDEPAVDRMSPVEADLGVDRLSEADTSFSRSIPTLAAEDQIGLMTDSSQTSSAVDANVASLAAKPFDGTAAEAPNSSEGHPVWTIPRRPDVLPGTIHTAQPEAANPQSSDRLTLEPVGVDEPVRSIASNDSGRREMSPDIADSDRVLSLDLDDTHVDNASRSPESNLSETAISRTEVLPSSLLDDGQLDDRDPTLALLPQGGPEMETAAPPGELADATAASLSEPFASIGVEVGEADAHRSNPMHQEAIEERDARPVVPGAQHFRASAPLIPGSLDVAVASGSASNEQTAVALGKDPKPQATERATHGSVDQRSKATSDTESPRMERRVLGDQASTSFDVSDIAESVEDAGSRTGQSDDSGQPWRARSGTSNSAADRPEAAPSVAPPLTVHIGRINVRQQQPVKASPSEPADVQQPNLTLAEYLARRNGRR